jgi:Domain of unknown function (DUF4249)
MKKILLLSTIVVAVFTACQKEISIDLPEAEQRIVVDGGIYVGQTAELNLTWSAGYFDPVDSASLAGYLITNALVTVSNGTLVDTLQLAFNPYRPIPIVWRGSTIVGQVGETYTLSVTVGDKHVTAVTTIPSPIPLDSVWFKVEPSQDSLGFAWAHMTDPVGLGNGYRWFAKRLNRDSAYIAPFGSSFDDRFIEGKSFDFAYNRRSTPADSAQADNERGYYKIGDVVVVQFCSIGQAEVNFWRTFETELANNGNPFAAPGVVETNVQGGLGIFCGYSPSYDTIYCQ